MFIQGSLEVKYWGWLSSLLLIFLKIFVLAKVKPVGRVR